MSRLVFGETNSGADRVVETDPGDEGLFARIDRMVKDSENDIADWSDKQSKFHKLRMRIKKKKTFPFIGSSNIRMPTAEINIRKIKSAVMGVVFGVRPIVQVLPTPNGNRETALKIEKLIDHLVMDVIDVEPKAEILVDQSLEKGFYLAKSFWRTEVTKRTEEIDLKELPLEEVLFLFDPTVSQEQKVAAVIQRLQVDTHKLVLDENMVAIEGALKKIADGVSEFNFEVQDVTYNFPDVSLVSPERFYVPSESGFNPQELETGTHEFFMPLSKVIDGAERKGWSKDSVDQITSMRNVDLDKNTDLDKDEREGISRLKQNTQLVRIWETFAWMDLNGDGVDEKVVVTSAPDFKQVLRKTSLTQLSGEYPIEKFYYEITDDRWYSHRGVPELLEDIIKEIDVQHNMKIDSQTIRNAPMFVYRAGMVNPNLIQMNPNQGIPVNGLQPLDDTIKVMNLHNPNTEFSYEREQMLLETKVQEMLGQIDFGLQSQINRRQPRTLGEVEAQAASAQRTFSQDAKHYIHSFSKLFNRIYELWAENGDDEYEFNYFGGRTQGERIRLTKEEIQGKYIIKIRGNDNNTNPNTKIQKAQQILAAVRDPLLLQLGIMGPQQIAEGIKRFYEALDIEDPETLINLQPQPQQPTAADKLNPKFRDLTEAEQAQVLAQMGVEPDVQSRLGSRNLKEAGDTAKMLKDMKDVGV